MPLDTLGFDPEEILDPVSNQPIGVQPIPIGVDEFDAPEENKVEEPQDYKRWKDHIKEDYFTGLSGTEQENFRRQYFEYRVEPQVPENDRFKARMQFDVFSAQDVTGKQEQQSRISSAGGSLARGFGSIVASLPKAIGEGAVNLANKFGDDPIWGNPDKITPEQTTSYKAGEAIEKWFNTFSVNPEYQDEFWASKIPEGAGSMLGFVAGGAAGKIAKIPVLATTMGLGAAATGVEGVEDYLSTLSEDEKADPAMRESAFNLNAILGTSEGLPIFQILNRLDGITGGGVKRILKEGFIGGLEELVQEVLQSIGQNAIAAKLLGYDPDRSLLTGTKEAGEVGFTLGFMLNTLAAMIGSRRTGKTRGPSVEEPPVDPQVEPALEGELLGPEQLGAPDERQDAMDTYMDVLEQKALPPPVEDTLAGPTTPEIGQTGDVGHITAKVDPETGHELIEDLPLEDTGVELLSGPQEDRREQVSISPTDERRAGNRRIDSTLRKKVEDMTPEERYQAIYIDRPTGLHNRRAFEDLPWRNYLASIDVDNLKTINDLMGHSKGDEALSAVGKAIAEVVKDSQTIDSYHISGDEFYLQADTKEQADEALKKVGEILKGVTVENKGISLPGLEITWGTDTHKDLADELMEGSKKTKPGRAGRGEEPARLTRTPEAQARKAEEEKKLAEAKALDSAADVVSAELETSADLGATQSFQKQFPDSSLVNSSSASVNAFLSERGGDKSGGYTKTVGDILKTESFKSEGYSGLNVNDLQSVVSGMVTHAHELEIVDRIIESIPINVVNDLLGRKAPAKMTPHDKTVLLDGLSAKGKAPVPTLIDIASSVIGVPAVGGTEVSLAPAEVTGETVEADAALGTIGSRQDVTPISDVELEAGAAPTVPALLNLTQETLQSKKVPEIRAIQRELGIPAKGKKADAIQSILNATQAPVEGTQVTIEPVSEGEATQDANELKSKQEAADAIARDRTADTTADAVSNIDETGCPR